MTDFNYEFTAMRGIQAGRCFYMTNVPMRVLVKMLRIDDRGSVLERSQRTVNESRAKKFAQYLINNPTSFVIPSLTGVIDLESGTQFDFVASEFNPEIGKLVVSMDSTIKLFDGQHRSSGIVHALAEKPELAQNTVSIQLYIGMSLEDRQLAFSDINQNIAKPSASISAAYNHRDAMPRFAVQLATDTGSPFYLLVDFEKNTVSSKSMELFPLKTIQDATVMFLGLGKNPSDKDLTKEVKQRALDFWKKAASAQGWRNILPSDSKWWREDKINTHTVMLKATALAGKIAAQTFGGLDKVDFTKWHDLDFRRNSDDFMGRCIRQSDYTMQVDKQAQELTANKLLLALGCPLPPSMASLERNLFGEFEQPKLPEPPKPKLDRQSKYATEARQKKILENAFSTESFTPEQQEEATEKLEQVMREWSESMEVTVEQARNLMRLGTHLDEVHQSESDTDNYLKILLNIRKIRAHVRICANEKAA